MNASGIPTALGSSKHAPEKEKLRTTQLIVDMPSNTISPDFSVRSRVVLRCSDIVQNNKKSLVDYSLQSLSKTYLPEVDIFRDASERGICVGLVDASNADTIAMTAMMLAHVSEGPSPRCKKGARLPRRPK